MDTSTIVSLQAMRFLAAGLVLLSHIETRLQQFGERYGFTYHHVGFSGEFGVDIFFVISGFIMTKIGWRNFAQSGATLRFMKNRIARIVPLYWAMTGFQVLLSLVLRDNADRVLPLNILRSLFFIPYLNSDGKHRPVLELGWSLDFEMFFYLVFAVCLIFPARIGISILLLVMGAAVLLGQTTAPAILFDPILLFFMAGVGLGLLRQAMGGTLNVAGGIWIGVGVIVLATIHHGPLVMDIAAIVSVAVVVLLADLSHERRMPRILAALGDASYSLYLVHGFALLFVGVAWRKLFGAEHLWGYTLLVIATALIGSWLAHCWIERPLSKLAATWLSGRSAKAAKAPAGA